VWSGPPNPGIPRPPAPADPRRSTGRRGEELAGAHLSRLGFAILARNVRTRAGEIDLIAGDGEVIAFVEVKTTRLARGGATGAAESAARSALERLGRGQRHRLRGLAVAWLRQCPHGSPLATELRFDAIGVAIDHRGELLALEHLEAAW
jgi:putative endonuclease